jgi:hypothetical protein
VTSLRRYDVVPHGMTLGGPSFASGANTVVYPLVTSSGVISNQYEEFQFTIAGSLEYATGLLASTTLDNTYPALSEAGGVALLTHSSGSSVNPGGQMIPAATTTVTVTSPGFEASPKVVTLTSATLSYQLLWLEDGTAVLLPQYIYRASNGVDEQVLALSPTSYRVGAAK